MVSGLLSKHGATVTTFRKGQEFLQNDMSRYDAIVIDYYMPDMKGFETIAELEKKCKQNCKICVFSGHQLRKSERNSLDGLGIRFVQKDRSACSKILNLLSSPDLRKCSSCTKWKPLTEFSGKATCDTCRPKKRKQGASAEKNKRATRDLLQGENERLRQVVMAQNSEITALKIQVSKQSDTIAHLQSGSGGQQQPTPRI